MGIFSKLASHFEENEYNKKISKIEKEIDDIVAQKTKEMTEAGTLPEHRDYTKEELDEIFNNYKRNKIRQETTEEKGTKIDKEVPIEFEELINSIDQSLIDQVSKSALVEKAINTDKLIWFVISYLTNPNTGLMKLDESDCKFCNTVSMMGCGNKIYKSFSTIDDLSFFDPESDAFTPNGRYLLSVKELKAKLDGLDLESVEQQIVGRFTKTKEKVQHPINFGFAKETTEDKDSRSVEKEENKETKDKSEQISKKDLKWLKKAFEPILKKELKAKFEKYGEDLAKIIVTIGDKEYEYLVDTNGVIMGGGKVYMMCPIPNDNIFVPVQRYSRIIYDVLSNPGYVLQPGQVQEILYDYFRNMNIYRFIDMSDTMFMNKLTDEEKQKLGKKLTFIINKAKEQGGKCPRMRFNSWSSVDEFMLISDPACKSPLHQSGETELDICEGLIYEVKGDNITQHLKGTSIEFHIDRYGVM